MAKTYCMCQGMRGEATRRGGSNGVRVSAQSYDGSVIVKNWYRDGQLMVSVGTNDYSSSWANNEEFRGTFEELKEFIKLYEDIKSGRVSIVRHRQKQTRNQEESIMKLFVLTHCAAEENYTPKVFKTEQEAITELRNIFADLVYDTNYTEDDRAAEYNFDNGKYVKECIDSYELYGKSAEIIYNDDTYDRFDIFEVEVE